MGGPIPANVIIPPGAVTIQAPTNQNSPLVITDFPVTIETNGILFPNLTPFTYVELTYAVIVDLPNSDLINLDMVFLAEFANSTASPVSGNSLLQVIVAPALQLAIGQGDYTFNYTFGTIPIQIVEYTCSNVSIYPMAVSLSVTLRDVVNPSPLPNDLKFNADTSLWLSENGMPLGIDLQDATFKFQLNPDTSLTRNIGISPVLGIFIPSITRNFDALLAGRFLQFPDTTPRFPRSISQQITFNAKLTAAAVQSAPKLEEVKEIKEVKKDIKSKKPKSSAFIDYDEINKPIKDSYKPKKH